MEKHIGIAACSAEGAALCYRTICAEGAGKMGRHAHPEITMHTNPLNKYMNYIYEDNWRGVAELMLDSAEKLNRAGADFCICPDNTIHQAYDMVIEKSPIPWLHIAEVVAAAAKARGFGTVAVMGTRYLMEGPVYSEKLAGEGVERLIPTADEREEINRIIFEELVYGIFKDESVDYFLQVIKRLKGEGAEAIVLGCTEIPLIINDNISSIPTLDSTRLLARSALEYALDEK